MTQRIALEIAVSTPDEAAIAEANGADRLELSSALEVGGLTPSMGLFETVQKAVAIPVYVLLRPRPGGFEYTDREYDSMIADANRFMTAGATGLVFGILTGQGTIDAARCRVLVEAAHGHAVFHRAFDLLPDQYAALDQVAHLGFRRVLTSGGHSTATNGVARIADLVDRANRRIEILPAGGIRATNVASIVVATKCDQVHSSASVPVRDALLAGNPDLARAMGTDQSGNRTVTDAGAVAALRAELDRVAFSLSSSV